MTNKILRLPQVLDIVGLSRSTIYAKIKAGEFPPQIRLSKRSSGWIHSEIQSWIDERVANSPANAWTEAREALDAAEEA